MMAVAQGLGTHMLLGRWMLAGFGPDMHGSQAGPSLSQRFARAAQTPRASPLQLSSSGQLAFEGLGPCRAVSQVPVGQQHNLKAARLPSQPAQVHTEGRGLAAAAALARGSLAAALADVHDGCLDLQAKLAVL